MFPLDLSKNSLAAGNFHLLLSPIPVTVFRVKECLWWVIVTDVVQVKILPVSLKYFTDFSQEASKPKLN